MQRVDMLFLQCVNSGNMLFNDDKLLPIFSRNFLAANHCFSASNKLLIDANRSFWLIIIFYYFQLSSKIECISCILILQSSGSEMISPATSLNLICLVGCD